MNEITSIEIKNKFLNFFENNKHLKINNASIIPKNDPTLLFINSGMAPLKRFFTGEENPPSKRLCNIQPCIRTIDIDEVGDKHHLTSFQMLGSWSIGDYFKEGAIKLAFDFLTKYINIPKEKLYVTIFGGDKELGLEEDNEAREYWIKAGVIKDHIVACPKEDNFWGPTSETGPCGPCTEIFYDTGDKNGKKYEPGKYFDTKKRYIEIWNAGVFMQFNKNKDGSYSKLKFKSVDTGAGLERLAMVLNNKDTVYDTDLLCPIKDKIANQIKDNNLISQREILIMTDHLRTTCLILSEKVKPSNEGRGYIPRKLIRKCILLTTKAGILNFNFKNILEFIIDNYKDMFPLFLENKNYILDTFEKEYEQFIKVITTGLQKLQIIKDTEKSIDANKLFELVTTFGLPFDIIKDYANENNLSINEEGFNKKLLEHKNISKNVQTSNNKIQNINCDFLNNLSPTVFKGYDELKISSDILMMIDDQNNSIKTASQGDNIAIILDKTVFYAESGGQCSDVGMIFSDKFKIEISNIQKTPEGVYIHFGKIIFGEINQNNFKNVNLKVDIDTRRLLANNHTTVHLLHSALRSLYGQELHQAGSKVEKDKLRFDFNCDEKIYTEDIFKLEQMVNSYIRMNVKVETEIKSLDKAIKEGAMALFENKYSDKVRVVSVSNISKELCGGTHTSFTGNIGLFKILSTEGIGKGIKRITAITGQEAVNYVQAQSLLIKDITNLLGVKPEKVIDKISNLKNQHNNNIKTAPSLNELSYQVKETKSGVKYVFISQDEFNKSLRDNLISLSDKIGGVVIYVGGKDKKQILTAAAKNISDKYSAKDIQAKILSAFSGKGGGSNRVASGGGVIASDDKIISIINNI